MQEQNLNPVQYIPYSNLPNPTSQSISQGTITLGFASKQWHIQFQTLTNLRQANKYYSNIFINQLLPNNYKAILLQVQNLRSNNSKQALTLLSEFIQHHQLSQFQPQPQTIPKAILQPIISSIVLKSTSEKQFIKTQALKGLSNLTLKYNIYALQQLCNQTQSPNAQISQLSIKLISQMIENNQNKITTIPDKFLKSLSTNLNGKRAFIQKKARQILNLLKNRIGVNMLEEKINESVDLLEEESNTLRKELKYKEEEKSKGGFKQFLKAKKMENV